MTLDVARLSVLLALLLSSWLVAAPPASAQLLDSPWPKYQSNNRNSGKTTVDGPSTTAVRERWAVPYEAPGWVKTQIAHDGAGVLYFAHSRNVACAVSAADGSLLWCNPDGSDANASSPALGNETSPGAGDYRIYRGERANRLWSLETDGIVTPGWPYKIRLDGDVFNSPAIDLNRIIYVTCGCLSNGMVHAFNADGTVRWTFRVGKGIRESSVALFVQKSKYDLSKDVTVVYVADVTGQLHAIEDHGRNDARLRFKAKVGMEARQASAAVRADGKVIYLGSKEGVSGIDDFDPATGQYGVVRWRVPTDGGVDVGIALDDTTGKFYVSSRKLKRRTFYEVTPRADNRSATFRVLAKGETTATMDYAVGPAAAIGANGLVYQPIGRTVMAFDPAGCASPCTPRWSYTLPGHVISLSLDAGAVYVTTKNSGPDVSAYVPSRVYALEEIPEPLGAR